jgi:inosine-uridine nucleoside N-ribohydrolase
MKMRFLAPVALVVALACVTICPAQLGPVVPVQQRLVIIDQDGAGPGGSDQMAMLVLLQASDVQVLGITIVTGDAWRDEETLHTLRMLELTGHSDVPVVRGAVFPLVRNQDQTRIEEALDGKVAWLGAWGGVTVPSPGDTTSASHGPYEIPPMPEGAPTTKPLNEDAAHFLIRQVRAHPHQVTIYVGGPLTNIALAVAIDPEFAALTKGIVIMGGSLNPQTNDSTDLELSDPRHEFNFWFDPEAAHIVLRADWPRIDVTTMDISTKAPFTQQMLDAISKSQSPAARYIAAWSQQRMLMWDELEACAWLDPAIITKQEDVYMDVDLSHGPSYGDTLAWPEALKPSTGVRLVHAQMDLDLPRFQKDFVDLMTRTDAK